MPDGCKGQISSMIHVPGMSFKLYEGIKKSTQHQAHKPAEKIGGVRSAGAWLLVALLCDGANTHGMPSIHAGEPHPTSTAPQRVLKSKPNLGNAYFMASPVVSNVACVQS